jgi:hypothetical protein
VELGDFSAAKTLRPPVPEPTRFSPPFHVIESQQSTPPPPPPPLHQPSVPQPSTGAIPKKKKKTDSVPDPPAASPPTPPPVSPAATPEPQEMLGAARRVRLEPAYDDIDDDGSYDSADEL